MSEGSSADLCGTEIGFDILEKPATDWQYEHFAGNRSINDSLNELLACSPEPSRSRMRKKIRQDIAALHKHRTAQSEEHAFHTFREFLVGWKLNQNGFALEYSKKVGGQTPDWFDESNGLILEVFTVESRGNPANATKRAVDGVAEKVGRYRNLVLAQSHQFVVGIHGDFDGNFDQIDCEDVAVSGRLFGQAPELSGVVFFEATNVAFKRLPDGSLKKRQIYTYTYFPNPVAARPIDLTEACRACLPFGNAD
jgi:hypothetical protein